MAHPLDPLSADEIRHVAATLRDRKGVGTHWRFASIDLIEPAKDELAADPDGIPRLAEAICWNTADGQAFRARVIASRRRHRLAALARPPAEHDRGRVA